MSLPLGLTMVKPTTAYNLVLDAGVGYTCINLPLLRSTGNFLAAVAEDAEWEWRGRMFSPKPLGATKDNTKVTAGRTFRDVQLNSIRGPMMGLKRTTNAAPMVETSLAEFGDWETALVALSSGFVEQWPNAQNPKYVEVTPGLVVQDTDYLPNIAIAATVSGKEQPLLAVLENVLVADDPELEFKDDDELGVPVKFSAHFSMEQPNAMPIHYFIPVESGSGS